MEAKDTPHSDSTQKHLENIGKLFQDRRLRLQKDVSTVAADSHITPTLLTKIEAGSHRGLTVELAMAICSTLDLDAKEVLRMEL